MPKGEKRTEIWNGNKLVNFDTERNRLFVRLLKQAFKNVTIFVDKRLKSKFAANFEWVVGNKPKQYNHHTHMHVEMGKIGGR